MIIEKMLNGYLNLDPENARRLSVMVGKVIALDLGYFNFKLYFLFTKDRIQLTNEFSGNPDVTLSGTPLDFLRLSLRNDSAGVFSSAVAVTGDTDTAQQFKEVFAKLDIDWEEQLSKITGDVVARQIGNFLRGFSHWAKQTTDVLRQDLTEYVHEEISLFPPREELQDFFHNVDQLRNDVERMELRVQRLAPSPLVGEGWEGGCK